MFHSETLGVHLDEKLNFNHHVKEKITKANKGIGVIKKLSNTLQEDALLILATQKTSLHFKAEQKLLSFPSSHGLLLNGTNLI